MPKFSVEVWKSLVYYIDVEADSADEIENMEEDIFLKADHLTEADAVKSQYELMDIWEPGERE